MVVHTKQQDLDSLQLVAYCVINWIHRSTFFHYNWYCCVGSLKPQQIQDSNCWLLMVNAANDHKWTSCLVLWPVSGPNNNLTTGKLHCFWNGYFNIQTTISSTSSFSPVGVFQVTMLKLQWLHCRITGWTFSYHIRTYLFKERRHELIKPPDQYLRVKEPCRLSYFHFCSVSSVISTNWHTHAEVAQLLHRNLVKSQKIDP